MKELSIEDIKEIQLEILKAVVGFCEKNNIRYFLCGGTLLGAIRHKGYIPWDDDIDLMMPREDYERFYQIFEVETLKLTHYKNTKNYPWPFIKISDESTISKDLDGILVKDVGVNIDVFPIDGYPTSRDDIYKHVGKLSRLRTIYWNQEKSWFKSGRSFKQIIEVILSKLYFLFYSKKHLLFSIDKIAQSINYNEAENVGIAVWGYGLKEVNIKEAYSKAQKVEFENNMFDAPIGYDTYLRTVYGNYMEWPPVEKRVGHQGFMFFKK